MLRRLFVTSAKISDIIKNFANVHNTKRTMKLINKTLIKEKSKFDARRRRIEFNFY